MSTRKLLIIVGCLLLAILALTAHLAVATPPAQESQPTKPAVLDSSEAVIVENVTQALVTPGGLQLPPASIAAIMTQNFEGTWPATGWQLIDASSNDGGDYRWGKRNCHPHAGTYAGWSVGGGAQGSALGCSANYPNYVYTWALYGPFTLSNATGANLAFHLWGQSEGGTNCPYDYLFAGSSIDGANFGGGTAYCGSWTAGTAGNSYYQQTLDLTSRLGQSQVWVAFLMASDSSNTYNGFTIDDVSLNLTGLCPDVVAPAGVGVEDIQAFANHWQTVSGGANWDYRFDLNQDARVDMVDVMLANAQFGRTCGGGPPPTPTATPTRTPTPTPTPTPDPLFHTALSLDGVNDYASAPDSGSLDLGVDYQSFTIETFFFIPNTTTTGGKYLVLKPNAYSLSIGFSTSDPDVLIFRVYASPTDFIELLALNHLSVGWHHIAAVYVNEYTASQDMVAIFLDGNRLATNAAFEFTPGLYNSSSVLYVGGYSAGTVQFSRWIEEMRFSSTVRYGAATYTVPTAPFTGDGYNRALWHFSDTIGSTVFQDSSGQGNTLTGYNGAQTGNP